MRIIIKYIPMYVCLCHGISDRHLREEVERGVCTFDELQARTGVGTCCGACEPVAREFVAAPAPGERAAAVR